VIETARRERCRSGRTGRSRKPIPVIPRSVLPYQSVPYINGLWGRVRPSSTTAPTPIPESLGPSLGPRCIRRLPALTRACQLDPALDPRYTRRADRQNQQSPEPTPHSSWRGLFISGRQLKLWERCQQRRVCARVLGQHSAYVWSGNPRRGSKDRPSRPRPRPPGKTA
jgi:hypothetical protein